ncbi:acetate kinase [Planctomycetales bacterium]|nr:acetate kinase [Planctomycetales bacterium]GHT01032.1 acetate kinase [Planctomycetales bacterium]GHT02595.1 acetate kinase [Planctomycetales bacterium]GHV22794.1 acetate kinase [Planctomycetales bacterium]
MLVLVINCGSSSIKYQLFDMPTKKVLAKGLVERIGLPKAILTHKVGDNKNVFERDIPNHEVGMQLILDTLVGAECGVIKNIAEIKAAGHRVVHGGEKYNSSVAIDDEVIRGIEAVADLAPLHNPPNLVGIRAAQKALPGVPQVAVFDTAFHQTIPPRAYLYALPYELYEKHQVRRYGFHGTSHAYVTGRAAELLGIPRHQINLITCHLGNGGSITAVKEGRSIDTSMGMTPLAGVVMGTRSGDLDPAIAFYLLEKGVYKDYHEVDRVFNKESGLKGVSGGKSDMRDLHAGAVENGENSREQLALDIFDYRVTAYIGAYLTLLPRLDALVFTGGIGENDAATRWSIVKNLAHLNLTIDPIRNRETVGGREGEISSATSGTKVMVVPTDEEGFIAADTYRLTREG